MDSKRTAGTHSPDTRRRDLSGIYIFDTLPQDTRRKPTCLEDCTESTRLIWLRAQTPECLARTAEILNECLDALWRMLEPDEQREVEDACGRKPRCDVDGDTAEDAARDINRFCLLVRRLADMSGICAPGSEADPDHKPEEDD